MELVSEKVALLAKNKGFKESCRELFDSDKVEFRSALDHIGNDFYTNFDIESFNINGFDYCLLPTQSQLVKWLREKYNCHVYVEPYWNKDEVDNLNSKPEYAATIIYNYSESEDDNEYFESWEEAMNVGLEIALLEINSALNNEQA